MSAVDDAGRALAEIRTVGMAHPWVLLRAPGIALSTVADHVDDVSGALEFVEPEFGPSVLAPVQLALDGAFDECSLVIFDREHHAAFLFIKELHRRGRLPNLAPIHHFDFIADFSPASRRHNRRQVDALIAVLQRQAAFAPSSIRHQLVVESRLNVALAGLQRSRRRGHIDGVSAKALLATVRSREPEDVIVAARSVPTADLADTIKVLLVPQGSDAGTEIHALVRDAGGNVVDEEDYFGSRSVGPTSAPEPTDFIDVILDQMHLAPGTDAITPLHEAFAWYQERLSSGDIDLVVVVTQPSDQRRGWEVPHRRRLAAANRIPFVHVHEDLRAADGADRAVQQIADSVRAVRGGGMT